MIRLTGGFNSDLCDTHANLTRRDLLRLGGASILGRSLGSFVRDHGIYSRRHFARC